MADENEKMVTSRLASRYIHVDNLPETKLLEVASQGLRISKGTSTGMRERYRISANSKLPSEPLFSRTQ